jgi:hypothetical protein
MTTLTSADIKKIEALYRDLEHLHAQRGLIKALTHLTNVSGEVRKGTSGLECYSFNGFTPEAQKEIREIIARDLRRRAAKIVEALHKYGCEAKLTDE